MLRRDVGGEAGGPADGRPAADAPCYVVGRMLGSVCRTGWIVAALAVASGCGVGEPNPSAPPARAPRAAEPKPRPKEDPADCSAERNDPNDTYVTIVGAGWAKSGGVCRPVEAPSIPISGRVVYGDGVPMRRVDLRLWSPLSKKNARTNESGAFELTTDVEGATYDVDALLDARAAEAVGRRRVHLGTLRAGDRDVVLRASIPQPVEKVLAFGTLMDEDGAPLAGWHVVANSEKCGEYVASGDTDEAGRFRLTAFSTPLVYLDVESRDASRRRIESRTVDPTTGETRIVMSSPGLIAGRVVAERGGTVAGAVVRLTRVGGDDVERTATVDASGDFAFRKLDVRSTYRLHVECAGFHEEPRENECSVDRFDVRLFLARIECVVAGRLLSADGSGARAAWLRFVAVDGKDSFQAMTDEDGGFRTSEAREVEYDVRVLTPGADSRLAPGPSIGRCRGGATSLLFRLPR